MRKNLIIRTPCQASADPKGAWGVGIVWTADEAAVHALEATDPAIRSKRGFRYEILPMPGAKF
jgi:hypothetical protein